MTHMNKGAGPCNATAAILPVLTSAVLQTPLSIYKSFLKIKAFSLRYKPDLEKEKGREKEKKEKN